MEDNYNIQMVKLMCKGIVDNIGYDKLYTDINEVYDGAPRNFHFTQTTLIANYLKKCYAEMNNPITICIVEDSKADENIHGIYINHGNTCYISINGSLNSCWRRFAIIKELCSLYVDHYDKEGKMKKYDNYLDSIKNAFVKKSTYSKGDNIVDNNDLDSETFSILLATEIMLPYQHRDILRQLFTQVKNNEITMNDVAKSLLFPEFVLQHYYDHNFIDSAPAYEDFGH